MRWVSSEYSGFLIWVESSRFLEHARSRYEQLSKDCGWRMAMLADGGELETS